MNDSSQYFEALYHHNNDPWGYDLHWYEARKRQICLALLTQQRYSSVLEIGCSNGHLSVHLAKRADQLLCLDFSEHAVHWAAKRLQNLKHVSVQHHKIPEYFPEQKFDLIVISEVAYYLSRTELHELIGQGLTYAKYQLKDTKQVHNFLELFLEHIRNYDHNVKGNNNLDGEKTCLN